MANKNKFYIEYACYNKVLIEDVRTNIFQALEHKIDGISIPIMYMGDISNLVPPGTVLSCPIDYPDGMQDTQFKIYSALKAYHNKATAIDIVLNLNLYKNGKLKEFRTDISNIRSLCKDKSLTFRAMLDYRKIDNTEEFKEVCKLVKQEEIEYLYCSTGHINEDYLDNIILCSIVAKDYGINTIVNGSLYLDEHFEVFAKAELFGIRFHHLIPMKRFIWCINSL